MNARMSSDYDSLKRSELIQRLEIAEETLQAIRSGAVDAVVVSDDLESRIYTLKDAEHPYRVMVEEMSEGALTLTQEGVILYCNSRFAELLGMPMESILGRSIFDFISLRQLEDAKKQLRQSLKSPTKMELLFQAGSVEMHARFSMHRMDLDGSTRLVALVVDLRDIRQAEETIRRQSDQYATLLSTTADGVWLFDREGRIIDVNQAYCQMSGYSRKELLGKTIAQVEKLKDPQLLAERIEKISQDGYGRMESRHYKKNGRPMDVEISVAYLPEAGQFIQFAHDITHRKRTETRLRNYRLHLEDMVSQRTRQLEDEIENRKKISESLRTSEKRYRQLVEHAPVSICEINLRTGRFNSVNQAMCAMLGYSKSELQRKSPYRLLVEENRAIFKSAMDNLLKGKYPDPDSNFRIMTKDGRELIVLVNVTLTEDDNGQPVLATIVGHDITEQKRYEQQLKGYSERLERSNKELEDFAYIASHDLQEPLRKVSIFGSNLNLKLKERLTDEECDQFDRLLNATSRMQEMVADLLELSRITTQGKSFELVDLGHVLQDVIADLEINLEKLGGKVTVDELPVIKADPVQIERLFLNLIGNSLKYHREEEAPSISVTGKKVHYDGVEGIEIGVADNGIGFDMAHAEAIFQPFRRLNGRSEYEGSGMGLAISKRIVERHGGRIYAESVPGQGSKFTVILPMEKTK